MGGASHSALNLSRRAMGAMAAFTVAAFLQSSVAIAAVPPGGCPNEAFRFGAAAALPDCRAYELVTPPDTNGRFVGAVNGFGEPAFNGRFPTELASSSAASIIYMSHKSPLLSIPEANGTTDVYQAVRSSEGWRTIRRLNPPGSEATMPIPGGVASDHSYSTMNVGNSLSSMALGGQTDYLVNPDGSYELVGSGTLGTEPFVQTRWISEGGQHIIFSSGLSNLQSIWCFNANSFGTGCDVQQLEAEAPPTGTGAIYDRSADGPTHVISLLPGNVTPGPGQEAIYRGTSRDASSVAFSIDGILYVRVDNGDILNADTLKVAEGGPTFAGLSDDGRYLFYVAEGNIHRFDTATGGDGEVNTTGDAEVVNVSADGSHVYFISESQIDGKGTVGQPNLYGWSIGGTDYIATVVPSDLEGTPNLTTWTRLVLGGAGEGDFGLGASSARSTPDGRVLVFESRAQLTPYNNAGHTEIYRYQEGMGVLCVSCSEVTEPATADARLQELELTGNSTVIHSLTADGSRVFFETSEALIGLDTGETNDIYQWRGEGTGPAEVALISSGRSPLYLAKEPITASQPRPNILLSVTPDGRDVVFLSQDVLVPGAGEGGTTAIYDARAGGGFPANEPTPACRDDECHRGVGSAPSFLAPPSEGTNGSGNLERRKQRRRCHRPRKHKKQKGCRKSKGNGGQIRQAMALASSPGRLENLQSSPASVGSGPSAPSPLAFADPDAGALAPLNPVGTRAPAFEQFGFLSAGASLSNSAAGNHSDFTTSFTLNHRIDPKTGDPEADARTEEVGLSLPPGLVGNPRSVPRCSTGDFTGYDCPLTSQVGVSSVITLLFLKEGRLPVFNLEPPHPNQEIARFGTYAFTIPIFIDVKVRTAGDYGVTATVHSAPSLDGLVAATTTIWGNPSDPSHDAQRMTISEVYECGGGPCKGSNASELPPISFLTNPSACQDHSVGFEAKSYQLPGQVFNATAPLAQTTNCSGLPFDPSFVAQPTNRMAGAPTGLETVLRLPQSQDPTLLGTATMREARVTLPQGMQIAAGAANWIGTCSEEEVGYGQEVDEACPDASKLGTATITSPALSRPLEGELFQRNPAPGRQFGLWLVSDDMGLHVKLPGELEPDPATGRLTAVFRDLPQVPVEQIELNVWGGPRAPLENPDSCGTYTTNYTFAPHSNDPAVSGQSQMTIDQGCDQGFSPTLRAGVTEPIAGRFSPFVFDLTRDDGQQALRGFELHLPDGELAKIAGVPLCPDVAAAAGSCPEGSRIGSLQAAAGPGPDPLWIPQPGKAQPAVYLAGPYQGSPFSIVSQVPAQAGPFDLGVVVVRSALHVDPETARATVKADPLPQFFEGVGITYRRLHAVIDRPEFSLNPTDCREMAVTADVTSTQGTVARPAARFQVDGCKALKFKPRVSLRLRGGTKRSDYPALSALVRTRKGDANIGRVSVALPHSEFLAQEHINTICTRKQFAAGACPKGSIYGRAKAWTPLLDKPLAGPVYLRSSDNPLPDLVMALGGELDIALVGRIDSVRGGIRTTFEAVPDAPVTKFVLKMRGGKKSLLTNSQDICRGVHRADIKMRAQNGRLLTSRPMVKSGGCERSSSSK